MSEAWRQGSSVAAQCDTPLFVNLRLLSDGVKDQLLVTIQKTFNYSRSQAQQIFLMVMECMKKRALVGPASQALHDSSWFRRCID